MREFLFRGKMVDTGKWLQGSLLSVSLADQNTCFIRQGDYTTHCRVITETVGQCTGLTDKNGKKIFEGDIVQFEDAILFFDEHDEMDYKNITNYALIDFDTQKALYHCLKFKYDKRDSVTISGLKERDIEFVDWLTTETEVVGNIHDNPKLLKEI